MTNHHRFCTVNGLITMGLKPTLFRQPKLYMWYGSKNGFKNSIYGNGFLWRHVSWWCVILPHGEAKHRAQKTYSRWQCESFFVFLSRSRRIFVWRLASIPARMHIFVLSSDTGIWKKLQFSLFEYTETLLCDQINQHIIFNEGQNQTHMTIFVTSQPIIHQA